MIVLWITLLVLHQGHTLIPVIPVQLGESTTFTCDLSNTDISRVEVHWYKQSVGDNLKLIVNLREHITPQFAPEFPNSRWKVNIHDDLINMTILKTIQEDEGIYHCAIVERLVSSKWSGTYLIVKVCLAISVIVNIVFICYRTPRSAREQVTGTEFSSSQTRHDIVSQPVLDACEGGQDVNYAALHFSGRKAARGKKKTELKTEESVYSQVKCQM
ncbi:uncharacterized protein LOC103367404 [Stegastes partitus]|uniref:Uncharacterized protein LOC103367404 n=1 Tax=Stegastes partitus TaxID=144197 RepID=A0A9Y4KM56_9TELE|nr:PREDICTED: uncharacterized protein LOC103367404 [Stegastes partitus]